MEKKRSFVVNLSFEKERVCDFFEAGERELRLPQQLQDHPEHPSRSDER